MCGLSKICDRRRISIMESYAKECNQGDHTMKKMLQTLTKSATLSLAAVVFAASALATIPAKAAEVTLGGARDCDANAIIYCGTHTTTELISAYNSGKESTSAKSIQDTFSYFGISSAQVNVMRDTAVAGRVTSNGEVYVNGNSTPVANSAVSAGRQNMSGSTRVTQNGTVFYTRPTSVSFRSGSIPAFVVMENGSFKYAVLASCGNPVKANPVVKPQAPPAPTPKKPDYTIDKTVTKHGQDAYAKSVSVKSGEKVTYHVVVKSTGDAPVPNQVVRDVLPAGVTYVDNTLTATTGSANDDQFFDNGITTASFANGQTITYGFDAIVRQGEQAEDCRTEQFVNTAITVAPELPEKKSDATVEKTCVEVVKSTPTQPVATPPQPVLPATGAGAIAGLFATVSTLGAVAYRWFIGRRLA